MALEEGLEQPGKHHGVSNLGYLELIETEQVRLGGDLFRHWRDRVVASSLHTPLGPLAFIFGKLAPCIQPVMNFGHELMEVNPAAGFDRCMLEEQIHQHGFAAPYAAPHVKARYGLRL